MYGTAHVHPDQQRHRQQPLEAQTKNTKVFSTSQKGFSTVIADLFEGEIIQAIMNEMDSSSIFFSSPFHFLNLSVSKSYFPEHC